MIGSWLKLFVDGSVEHGSDYQILDGDASWSKGRLENIISVMLSQNINSCSLYVENTEWHQFDRYIVPVSQGTHTSQRTHRVLQAKIQEHHLGLYLNTHIIGSYFRWISIDENGKDTRITKEHIDKWLTVILPLYEKTEIKFLNKGKMDDN